MVALRTAQGKLGLYSNWGQESIEAESTGQEVECYEYGTGEGQAELANVAGSSALEEELRATLEADAIPNELHEPLPGYLEKPQGKGMGNYYDVDENEGRKGRRLPSARRGADRTDAGLRRRRTAGPPSEARRRGSLRVCRRVGVVLHKMLTCRSRLGR